MLNESIGRRVRAKRLSLGWTLDDLAHRSGVSRRMIVNVEQGVVNSSIGTLLRLSDALGIGIPSLVQSDSVATREFAHRAEGTTLWSSPGGSTAVLLAGSAPPNVLELWEWTLAVGDIHESEPHQAGTQEIAHIRTGSTTIRVGERMVTLTAGESLSFDGDLDHSYANAGSTPTIFTLAVFEPDVRPQTAPLDESETDQ
jgi:transcriptional regulator with XRE-family HTH domain